MDALLPTLIIFLSLVGLVFILFQKAPDKGEKGEEDIELKEDTSNKKVSQKKKKVIKWFKRIRKTPVREIIFNFWEKFLRRLRIIILRVDKSIADKLLQLKKSKFLKEERQKLKPFFEKRLRKRYFETIGGEELNKLDFNNLDLKEEEIKLLKNITKNFEDTDLLKNLARLYLWEKDYHSACWALLQVYYLNNEDKIIYDLLLEIKENLEKEITQLEKDIDQNEAEVAQR